MSGPGSRAPPDAIRRSEDGRGVAERGAGDAEIARHEGRGHPPGIAARVVLEAGRRAVDERRLHTPHEALARGIGLDAAALPADTGYAVRDDLGVTELARDIARALEEQAVHHRARADSRADEDGDQALGSPPHPESVLAPGRRAHVVLHVGRQAERRFDLVT